MVGFAGKAAVQAAGAVNRLHHAERQTRLLQARPLLDMQFQIGGDILRVAGGMGDPRRIESGIHQRRATLTRRHRTATASFQARCR